MSVKAWPSPRLVMAGASVTASVIRRVASSQADAPRERIVATYGDASGVPMAFRSRETEEIEPELIVHLRSMRCVACR
jgi:CTP:molybdopterin cytidylyltransferase MocA